MKKKIIAGLSLLLFSLLFVATREVLERLELSTAVELIFLGLWSCLWILGLNFIYRKFEMGGYDPEEEVLVEFHEIEEVADHVLKFAVIMAQYEEEWLFVRHEDRKTWEIPGGKREPEELILKTAARELAEETGAIRFEIDPVMVYSVTRKNDRSFGLLCYAKVFELGDALELEICEVKPFDKLPQELTYPSIQPILFKKMMDHDWTRRKK